MGVYYSYDLVALLLFFTVSLYYFFCNDYAFCLITPPSKLLFQATSSITFYIQILLLVFLYFITKTLHSSNNILLSYAPSIVNIIPFIFNNLLISMF